MKISFKQPKVSYFCPCLFLQAIKTQPTLCVLILKYRDKNFKRTLLKISLFRYIIFIHCFTNFFTTVWPCSKCVNTSTVKPLNSGHLRVLKNLSVVKRCPLLGGSLTKMVTLGTKHFVRYSRYVCYWEVSLYFNQWFWNTTSLKEPSDFCDWLARLINLNW